MTLKPKAEGEKREGGNNPLCAAPVFRFPLFRFSLFSFL
jgi:hypothetical protein